MIYTCKNVLGFAFASPLITGVLYILLIPAYAFLYSFFPNDFYITTAKWDPSLREAEEKLESKIGGYFGDCEIIKSGVTVYAYADTAEILFISKMENVLLVGYHKLVPTKLLSPGVTNREMHQNRLDEFVDVEYSGFVVPKHFFWTPLGHSKWEILSWLGGMERISGPRLNDAIDELGIEHCYPPNGSSGIPRKNLPKLDISVPSFLVEEFRLIASSYNSGLHAGYGGEFIRFVYFSTVTITTLGYGDILPVTDRGRLMVASESILGVVLIGLFLNAVARRR